MSSRLGYCTPGLLKWVGMVLLLTLAACNKTTPVMATVPHSAMEQASGVNCARGLDRIERIGGVEDSFALTNSEPSRIRPARLPNAYLEAITAAKSGAVQLRDYDEAGQDKVLIDHFEVPPGIVSGALVIRLRTSGGSTNDSVRLGNLDEQQFADGYVKTETYSHKLTAEPDLTAASEAGEVLVIRFESLAANARAGFKGGFVSFLNRKDRPGALDFEVEDDTAVDVAILVLCQQPQVAHGTTFTEFRTKIAAPEVSLLSCFLDKTQAPCNPFQGDQVCTAKLPMACYKPGDRVPSGIEEAGLGQGYGAGGEVRTTAPVAAGNFATRPAADSYCAGQFGAGWRVLEYHDGSGGAIATYSNIAPKTRVWIDVSDQRYANCWDRDKNR